MGIKIAVEAHRRKKPISMGTLVWQLNDVWPVVSWSSIDSYGHRKAQHYQMKRLYEDLLIVFYGNETSGYDVHIISDYKTDLYIQTDIII